MVQVIAQRYQILEEVGKGGMGTVYHGLDTHAQQTVAIKQLKLEVATPELIERFIREGAALRELNHPNIVKMLDSVQENGKHYLIIEYLPGGDLNTLLKAGQLPIEKVLQLSIDICDALTRAHRLNIIHRDLKPANVLLADDGTPRLTDFGIAHMAEKERVTATDAIVGTIDYLAPETLNGEGTDPGADIWAFGVMLFEMLTGERPFTGTTLTEILTAILIQPVPDLETLRPDIPIALIDLVYRMLEKSRDARIRSVRHVGAALEDILSGHSDHTPPETRFAAPTPNLLTRPKHNLPAQTTPFVGRKAELHEVARLLDDPKIRLITVLAPGGMGKSRLALELAEKALTPGPSPRGRGEITGFENGVYFVELAPLSDPANIVSAIADATGYQFQGDGREPKQQIFDFLRNKHMLLVLDNYEHLLDGAGLVTDILQAAPDVQILATSRQRLSQPGETLFHLAGMDFPTWETPEDALEYAAVKLFMNSAQRARPAFELKEHNLDDIARICRLVQGMPLAIVLAASWLAMLSLAEIAAEIQQSLDFLADEAGQVPERQHSIRAVFDYSWQQMTEAEQQVFMKLSVFRGGFTREAAQAVAGANLRILMSLMNKSLVRRDADSGRYEIHELLRQYAEGKLSAEGETETVRDNHAHYFAEFITPLGEMDFPMQDPDMPHKIATVLVDFENIRAAWHFYAERKHIRGLRQLLDGIWRYCDTTSRSLEGIELFEPVLVAIRASEVNDTALFHGQIMLRIAWFYSDTGRHEESLTRTEKALEQLKLFDAPADDILMAYVLLSLLYIFLNKAKPQQRTMLETSMEILHQTTHSKWQSAIYFNWVFYYDRYEPQKALEWLELLPESGFRHQVTGGVLNALGDYHGAEAILLKASQYPLYKLIDRYAIYVGLIYSATKLGEYERAGRYRQEILKQANTTAYSWGLTWVLTYTIGLHIGEAQYKTAVELLSLVLHHPATSEVTRQLIIDEGYQKILETILPPEDFKTAWEHGKSLDLETVVQELLAEFGEDA